MTMSEALDLEYTSRINLKLNFKALLDRFS